MTRRLALGVFALLALSAAGCATPQRSGETGEEDRAGLFQQLNARYGGGDEGDIEAGTGAAPEPEVRKAKIADAGGDGSSTGLPPFVKPLNRVVVTSPFGERSGDYHDGVDLKASVGTPVYAAHSGLVLYADKRIRGYGKMIVLKHSSGLSTVYAHNSQLFVKRGSRVLQGQKIALSGQTGRAKGPHLHFEVRRGMQPLDPEPFLARAGTPRAQMASGAGGKRGRATASSGADRAR